MSDFTHTTPRDFKAGERVAIHPAHDAFMRGLRYATVEHIGNRLVHIRFDRLPKSVYTISPKYLAKVD